ncbi:hypothetical protein HK405_010097, partial [Cladochytrium tenue]
PDRVEVPSPHPPEMHSLAYEWYASARRGRAGARVVQNYPLTVDGAAVRLKPRFERLVRRMQEAETRRRREAVDAARAAAAEARVSAAAAEDASTRS